ncbi:sodium channel protein Nach [Rhagoletis pomonella]|uniref:sodium channel protein Nach n=1 Tax=Rhagoletis pomonella TaxID=28610 RepID=UPI001785CE33|nr:sodium channel protein Nach [Rhagoletis pomonella]
MANPLRKTLKCTFFLFATYFTLPFVVKVSVDLTNNFFTSSISFNLDTLYINWNTTFPAVTVCEIYNGEKVWDISEKYFGTNHDLQLDDFVSEVVYFRGTCTTCDKCERIKCPQNFTELLTRFRSECSQLLFNCRYINRRFNCCDEFLPIHTEYGICFTFNSNQARKSDEIRFASNREIGPGNLKFDTSANIQLLIHSPIDIPLLSFESMIRETILLGSSKELIINVMEVYNHASVYQLSLDQRRCRFRHERTDWGRNAGFYDYYSFPTCIVECVLVAQLQHCNCSSHLLVPSVTSNSTAVPACDYRGLSCLTRNYEEIQLMRKSCDCMSSCEEPEYNIVYNSPDGESESDLELTQVLISLIELPTQRYIRRVTKTPLDLLISVGGIVGLFLNASLLRLLELVFLVKEFMLSFYGSGINIRIN